MNFDPKDLEALAGVLLTKGAPIIANMLGGPVAGGIASVIVPQLAQAFGLPADAPAQQVASAVQADPNAADKLATFTEQNRLTLALLQLQVDQNNAELQIDGPPLIKFFYGGWRPAMGWISGPGLLAYQVVAFAAGLSPLPDPLVNSFLLVWTSIAGLRTYERWSGVSIDTLSIRKGPAK